MRKTKKRRNYYICENNPKTCDYISWNKPKPGEKIEEADEELAKEVKKKTPTKRKSTTKKTSTKKNTRKTKK